LKELQTRENILNSQIRTTIVTGGAGSIGLATSARLVARDMRVLVVDKDAHQIEQIADRFKDKIVNLPAMRLVRKDGVISASAARDWARP
jgi:NADP-dependent 3-hydroxy acid dehydrogenase YdfG